MRYYRVYCLQHCLRAIVLLLPVLVVLGSDSNFKHYHSGKLKPYTGQKLSLNLTSEEVLQLESRGVVSAGVLLLFFILESF